MNEKVTAGEALCMVLSIGAVVLACMLCCYLWKDPLWRLF